MTWILMQIDVLYYWKEVVNCGVVIDGVVVIDDGVVIDDDVAIGDAVILTLLNFSENTWDLPIILDYQLCIYRFLQILRKISFLNNVL